MLKRPENSQIPDMKSTFLVVDDTASSRRLVKKVLDDLGFFTVIACDGETALAKVWEYPPDAIITDLEMPRMDGEELIETLRSSANPCICELPIIVSSSKVDRVTMNHLGSLRVNAIVPKPVDVRLLAKNVLRLFRAA